MLSSYKEIRMEYKFFDKVGYVRMDKGDEIISVLLEICAKERIKSAIFSGIGGVRGSGNSDIYSRNRLF